MTARTFAAIIGGLYLVLGIVGFVPPLWERPIAGPPLTIRVFHASLFGVFAINIISSMMHLTIGLWGTMAANSRYSALVFTRAGSILLLVLAVLGLIPLVDAQTLFGTVPLYGNNAWLHLATAAIGAIFSFRPGYDLTQVGVQEELNPHVPNK